MIIFGFSTKVRHLIEMFVCFACGQMTEHDTLQKRRWFTLFFIPVIPFHSAKGTACRNCGSYNEAMTKLVPEIAPALPQRVQVPNTPQSSANRAGTIAG